MDTPILFSPAFFTDCFVVDYRNFSYFIDTCEEKAQGTSHNYSAKSRDINYSNKKFALLYPEQHTKILEWLKTKT